GTLSPWARPRPGVGPALRSIGGGRPDDERESKQRAIPARHVRVVRPGLRRGRLGPHRRPAAAAAAAPDRGAVGRAPPAGPGPPPYAHAEGPAPMPNANRSNAHFLPAMPVWFSLACAVGAPGRIAALPPPQPQLLIAALSVGLFLWGWFHPTGRARPTAPRSG